MAGLYIHIPFCASRCIYCGFYSTTSLGLREQYVEALCHEMELRKNYISDKISTIYLGGGTPSQLREKDIKKLFLHINKVYDVSDEAEITIECNPDDITPEYATFIKSMHINRVSLGVQTFEDRRLQFLHRRHNAEEACRAVNLLRNAGIENLSIDLMFGFPNETTDDWVCDIRHALSLKVKHISAYSLMYEEGTALYKLRALGKLKEIDEETSLRMYGILIDMLKEADYEHYEISNFAKEGFRSRHNSSYWNGTPYIGIGAAAHSYDKESRQWNVADIKEYTKSIMEGHVPAEKENLDLSTKFDDMITTALRTSDGLSISLIEKSFGPDFKTYLMNSAKTFIARNLLEIKGDKIRLTRDGLYISDSIMSDLMHV